MVRYLRLYWLFLKQRLKILMEYRVNFIIGASSTVFFQAASLLGIWVVMQRVPTLEGWSYDEVLFVYGLLAMAHSITHMFADNLWTIGWSYIRTGRFDRFLVRPIDPLFHLLADRFCHDGIGDLLIGAAVVIKASLALDLAWSVPKVIYLVVIVLSGGGIFIALNLITSVSAFWIVESIPVTKMVFETNEFAKYPLTIYPRAVRVLMTWIIPYGLASFYPARLLLGRDFGPLAFAAPPVAALLLFVGYRLWRFGLRHYSSTGS